ncbi:MAG: hypothetical protein Q7J98_01220, partial [Kiritimatiellia bacterium]|nr:hypothetical protein [Kiritimatiellia bacterium]
KHVVRFTVQSSGLFAASNHFSALSFPPRVKARGKLQRESSPDALRDRDGFPFSLAELGQAWE